MLAGYRCSCGFVISNVDSPNDIELLLFSEREWEDFYDRNLNVKDIPNTQNDVWRCPECERLYFFERSKMILCYKIETDNR